jgi:hypothetical protein
MLRYVSGVSAPSTSRVQAHRQRKRQGARSVRVELTSDQLASLVDKHQYLDKSKLSDAKALRDAVQMLVSDALFGEIVCGAKQPCLLERPAPPAQTRQP